MPLKLYRRAGNPVWYIRGTIGSRRLYETTQTEDRTLAEAYRAKRETELFAERITGKRVAVSFERAALSYLEFEERSEATEAIVHRLADHFTGKGAAAIGQAEADGAVAALLSAKAKAATKRRMVYTPLLAILNHAAARGWCERPRLAMPSVPKGKTRWLTPQEALALMSEAAAHLWPLLHFLLCTGARMSEALDLEWGDVDLAGARVRFRDTKSGHDRLAALPESAIVTLANLPGRNGHVFRRDDGEPYADRERQSGGQIKTGFRGALRRAGIAEKTTPHDLRHTWASWFYALTKDPLLLKDEGGWSSLAMVERYAHLMPASLAPEIAKVWGASHPRIGGVQIAGNYSDPMQRPA